MAYENLFGFFVRLVAFAVFAELVHLQTYLQLWVAGRVVVVLAALSALKANHGLLWHIWEIWIYLRIRDVSGPTTN